MRGLRKIVLIALSGLLISFAGKNISSRELSPSALREDAQVLRKALEKYHPGLYWYTSREEFKRAWDSLDSRLDKPISEDIFFKLLLPVVAKVKCAHTLFYPSNEITSNGSRFPFDIRFMDGKAYLMSAEGNQLHIPKGSELLNINGRSVKEILDLLLPNLEAQGGNKGWKYVILENDFQNYYYYLIDHSENFSIEYVDRATGQKVFANIKGSADEKLRKHWKNWYPDSEGEPLKIKYQAEKRLAVITVKSFNKSRYTAYHQDFDKLIDQYFKEIRDRKIENLIIDVRGNEGGNQPEKLYAYLVKPLPPGMERQSDVYKIGNAKYNFEGNVIVLANEKSISAQESFVAIFTHYNRGLFIGRPTPGCPKYLCGGKKHKVVLPNSKFEINIPMNASIRPDPINPKYKIGEGYPPDFLVEENLEALLEQRDVVMEFALDKIK